MIVKTQDITVDPEQNVVYIQHYSGDIIKLSKEFLEEMIKEMDKNEE